MLTLYAYSPCTTVANPGRSSVFPPHHPLPFFPIYIYIYIYKNIQSPGLGLSLLCPAPTLSINEPVPVGQLCLITGRIPRKGHGERVSNQPTCS